MTMFVVGLLVGLGLGYLLACVACGKRVSGIKTAKFCSNACREGAMYAKHKRSDGDGER